MAISLFSFESRFPREKKSEEIYLGQLNEMCLSSVASNDLSIALLRILPENIVRSSIRKGLIYFAFTLLTLITLTLITCNYVRYRSPFPGETHEFSIVSFLPSVLLLQRM